MWVRAAMHVSRSSTVPADPAAADAGGCDACRLSNADARMHRIVLNCGGCTSGW